MEIDTAISLIKNGVSSSSDPQVWAELGAGTGLFTKALSTLLPMRSTVCAIDQNSKAIDGIVIQSDEVELKKKAMDFVNDRLEIKSLDGILMANALHFVKDKLPFLTRIKQNLKPSGRIVIIEYDRDTSNTWVPYPISFRSLEQLSRVIEASIEKIGSTPSKYHEANIYSALLLFK